MTNNASLSKQADVSANGSHPSEKQEPRPTNYLSPLGEKIFLDRYAWKDGSKQSLAVGDTVIVCVDESTRQREIATVETLDRSAGKATVRLRDDTTKVVAIEHIDKPLEITPAETMARIARGIAAVEPEAKRAEWEENFKWLLEDWKFVPGGRIWAGAGTDQNLTFYNCMPPDQLVLTEEGYKPIAEVQVGERVVTHRNRLRPVLHKFERETEEPLYIIKAKKVGYDLLRLTGEHKVLIIRSEWVNTKHKSRDGLRLREEPQWIPAQELKVGDFVAVAYDGERKQTPVLRVSDYLSLAGEEGFEQELAYEIANGKLYKPQQRSDYHGHLEAGGTKYMVNDRLEVDHELAYLFGRWLGDGCVTHRSGTDIPAGIKIVFGLDEKEDGEYVGTLIEKKFGVPTSLKLSSTGRWYDLWANSMPLGEFFKAFLGCYSYAKRLPEPLMHLPDDLTLELLHGLFGADGYISGNSVGLLLSNYELAVKAQQLLLRLGYFFSIFENTHENGRHLAYRLTATVGECEPLFEYFFGQEAPARSSIDLKYYFEYNDLRWVRITDITVENYAGTVLDMEVDEDHSFISAGLVVSNCYVVPSPQDSRGGIVKTLSQMMEIMSRGGGVGINVSSLRPRYSYVKGVNGRSSGAVSWGALYSFVTGLIEQGGCFGPNERILTDRGLIPAKELADRLEAGEPILAQTHEGLRPFTAYFRNGSKPLFEVTTKRGYKVRVSADHKMAVLRNGAITTIPLRDLAVKDEILLLLGHGVEADYVRLEESAYERSIMSTNLNTDVNLPTELDEDFAYLIGYMHGDGYIQVHKKVTWQAPKAFKLATADDHPTIRARLQEIIRTKFGLEPLLEDGDGALKNVVIYSRVLIEWLIQNSLLKAKSEDIRVPEVIFRSPTSVMAAFIAGYFDADGCNRGRKGGYGFDSVSREMLEDVQQLLAINGIVSRIAETDRSEEGWQTIYRLTVTGAPFKRRFAELIPAEKSSEDNGKRDMYNTYPAEVWTSLGARAKYRQRIYDGVSPRISFSQLSKIGERLANDGQIALAERLDHIMHTLPDKIISIELLGDSDVYDFEVDDVHLLSGGGIYTHNSRRGALMVICNDWHPDVIEFIHSKREMGKITNANISVGISDTFMERVKEDGDWDLVFPDTSVPQYDDLWDGDLDKWKAAGYPVIKYKTVKAREIWNQIIESAWASAEPGLWFRERSNKMSNSWYFNPLVSTNPCGEQPLSAFSVCNLGALNLARFVEEGKVEWAALGRTVRYATRFLDDVIDATPYFFEENAQQQLGERRVGLGVMGLAEMMIRLGLRYGSAEGNAFLDELFRFITSEAYSASSDFAAEKGAFPAFVPDKFLQSGFMQGMPEEIRQKVAEQGIRNVTLLTVAPTGTTGTMVNTSTGIEPYYFWSYFRKSRLGTHEEVVDVVREWREAHPGQPLPDYFVTAMDLSPEDHVRVQAAVQRWIDSSISKCVTGDTLVLTSRGLVPIAELSDLRDPDQFEPLELEVITPTGTEKTEAFYYGGMRETRRASLSYGYEIEGTPNHRVHRLEADGSVQFARMDELKIGDTVVLYSGQQVFGPGSQPLPAYSGQWKANAKRIEFPTHMSIDLAFVLGSITSEGSIHRNGVLICNGDRDLLERIGVLFKELFGLESHIYPDKRRDSVYNLQVNSRPLCHWLLNDLGMLAGAENKIIPTCIFTASHDEIAAFLRSLMLDGYMTLNGRLFGINLASRALIRQLQTLLLNFGVFSRIQQSAERAWALTVAGEALDILATFLEFEEVWKTERIGRRNEGRILKPSNYATLMPRPLTYALQEMRQDSSKSLRALYGGGPDYNAAKTNLNQGARLRRDAASSLYGYFDDAASAYANQFFEHDQPGCLYVEVQAIERGFAEVFDLTVPGSHSFIANGLCNHNTSNVPNHYTVEQTAKLYELMYELGCKGGTIYRDGSRDEQVLNLKEEDKAEAKKEGKAEVAPAPAPEVSPNYTNRGDHKRARPRSLKGATYFINTPVGKAYVTVNRNGGDQPFEVFANVGKVGSEGAAMSEAIGRLISLVLRLPSHISPSERLEMVISQLEGIGGSRSIGFGPNRVTSLPDALAQVLREDLAAHRDEDTSYLLGEAEPEPKQLELLASTMNADLCPECGHSTFVRIEGCKKCYSCGHSEC